MARLGEVQAAGIGPDRYKGPAREAGIGALPRCDQFAAEQPEEDIVPLRIASRMPLEAGTLEPLGNNPCLGIDELVGQRVAE